MTAVLLAAALLVCAALPASDHGAGGGPASSIQGQVYAAGGDQPVPGAEVRVDTLGLVTRADAAGRFVLANVPEGRWRVTASAPSYASVTVVVILSAEATVRIDFELPRETRMPRFLGRVVDTGSGRGVPGAEVSIVGGRAAEADGEGRFTLEVAQPGGVSVRAWAYGYEALDTVLQASTAAAAAELRLRPHPVGLQRISVRASGSRSGPEAERDLYDLEPRPGVIGIGRTEIRDIPAMVERDVLRSLQALPGVVQINDLSAQLHVRGGGPDQNLFLLDGARVFAPYHMFGIFGAFNTEAVARVQFFRGDLAARHGGALSSVIEIEQRDDASRWVHADAALGALASGATVRGVLPAGQGRWMLAGRKTTLGAVLKASPFSEVGDLPFAFHDVQARLSFSPTPSHRLTGSVFESGDRFRMFLLENDGSLNSDWINRVGSVRWLWDPSPTWSTAAIGWASLYDLDLDIGFGGETPSTRNRVSVRGARIEAIRRGTTGARIGVELQDGSVAIQGGDRPGGYVEGRSSEPYAWASGYAEVERELGPVRLAPGVRIEAGRGRGDVLVSPRLALRVSLTEDLAITAGIGRTRQALSTLRDDRYVIPGPPLWFAHRPRDPVSTADGLSAALEGWHDRVWSFSLGGYARAFRDLPVWRPAGDRTLDSLRWEEGSAWGAEGILRRHGERLHGWLSYGFSRARSVDQESEPYHPVWDRTHALDWAMFVRFGRGSVGTRVVYGTGTPFWAQAGVEAAKFLAPGTGKIEGRDDFPIWADEQLRFPAYFRADAQARYRFSWRGVDFEPYAGLLNLTARPNTLYYEYRNMDLPLGGQLVPRTVPIPLIPSLGLDIQF